MKGEFNIKRGFFGFGFGERREENVEGGSVGDIRIRPTTWYILRSESGPVNIKITDLPTQFLIEGFAITKPVH